jgi:citrate synthase
LAGQKDYGKRPNGVVPMTGKFDQRTAATLLCTSDRESITVRGKDLCGDIIGSMSLTGFFYFHITGKEPSPSETRMLDALLVAIAEHGLSPAALAARMTYAAAPEALQGAVAAGILGAGSVVLGAAGEVAATLKSALARVHAGLTMEAAATELVRATIERSQLLPGFGHPLHKPIDPRAVRLLALAEQEGIGGEHIKMLETIARVAPALFGKDLVMNVQGPIAAIACDMGLPPFLARAIPIIARAVGVLGHIAEEDERPIGFFVTTLANREVRYLGPEDANSTTEKE